MKRVLYVDILNIIACAGVLLLHSTNGPVHNFNGNVNFDWFIGLFSHSFFLWPVNVFFMLSGITMMRTCYEMTCKGEIKQYYLKRLNRLGYPLLMWSLIYLLIKIVVKDEPINIIPLLMKVLTFKANGFMWFFMPLIVIYLSMPFLFLFVVNAKKIILDWYMVLGLVLPTISQILYPQSLRDSYYVFGTGYLYFVVAGYYIGTIGIAEKVRKGLYWVSFLSAIFIFVATYWLTLYYPEHYRTFLSYLTLPCTLTALGVFTLFRYVDWNTILYNFHLTPHECALFSSFSLGIYLVQLFWFMFLNYFHLCVGHPLIRFGVMYVLCLFSVYILKQIPFLKRLVP